MRIFIVCGTQKYQFDRLMKAAEDYKINHPETELFAQRGASAPAAGYPSEPFLDKEAFDERIRWADLVLAHGGTGAIISALKVGTRVVVVPRKACCGEHEDDHQEQIAGFFEKTGHITVCRDIDDLDQCIREAMGKKPKPFQSNNQRFCDGLSTSIRGSKVIFTSSSGGHNEQLMMLKPLMQKYDSCIVTEQVDYRRKIPEGVRYRELLQVNRTERSFLPRMLKNTFTSMGILRREKPDTIVSTGVLATIPLCLLGKLTGRHIIYIETFAKLHEPTATGRLMYRVADDFYVQWESLQEQLPKAKFLGGVY